MTSGRPILVTGATGYVGGRVVPRLLEAGHRVRVLVRDVARWQGRPWSSAVETVQGDVLKPDTLPPALQDVEFAYYLVHSLRSGPGFAERDVTAARNFGAAARAAGVKRIIYLGGLGCPEDCLSDHLRSRQETGTALREAGVPVIEFRAGVIVGSGSLSFEMLRYLAERLPILACPQWATTSLIQPISIRNVVDYLVAALELPESESMVLEIGGPEVMSYDDMLRGYARVRGLRRWILPIAPLPPRLCAYWVNLVTPIPMSISLPLIESLRNSAIVRDGRARQLFPDIWLIPYPIAVRRALDKLEASNVETAWSDALVTSQGDTQPVALSLREGMFIERRTRLVDASSASAYRAFTALGGKRGWIAANWAWRVRGLTDRVLGGVGHTRGRRNAADLRVGDAVDFWRVERLVPDRMMLLRSEMKLFGDGWLQFEAIPQAGRTLLLQTAYYAPKGLLGLLYWYCLYPFHAAIFSGLVRGLSEWARRLEHPGPTGSPA